MKLTFLLFILYGINGFSQKRFETIPLNTIEPLEIYTDLNKLENLFNNKTLIGVGESTHGTSQFTTMRHRLFKYLVENFDINTFFIEADYSACQRINRYINGANDSGIDALKEIKFWTWRTKEMLELIEWAKTYNRSHGNQIKFIGCDVQFIDDDYLELKRILDPKTYNQLNIDAVFDDLDNDSNDSIIQSRYTLWSELKEKLNTTVDQQSNAIHPAHIRGIDHWFKYKMIQNYNLRDSCMAININTYLNEIKGSKGFYFAHNYHVSNTKFEHKKHYSKKTTGNYLKEYLGQNYLCLALLSQNLEFNAWGCIDDKKYFGVFKLRVKKKKSIEKKLMCQGNSLCYLDAQSISNISKYYIIEIGSVYKKLCDGYKTKSVTKLKNNTFDGFIFIEKTTATNIISY